MAKPLKCSLCKEELLPREKPKSGEPPICDRCLRIHQQR